MNRNWVPLILLLAIILIYGGCGNGNPVNPSMRGESSTDTTGVDVQRNLPGAAEMRPWEVFPGEDIRNLPQYIEGEVLIVLNEGVNPSALYPMAKGLGLSLMKDIKLTWGTVFRMSIDTGESVESMVDKLLTYAEVKYAEPNLIFYPCSAPYYPNDPLFEYPGDPDDDPWNYKYDQWGPNVLGASLVWQEMKGSEDVVVCVLDTGYRWSHEDLANQIWINEDEIPGNGIDDDLNGWIDDWRGWDTDDDDNDPWDTYGHGTACSGVVAAEQDNGVGCTGLAPGIKVMAVRCDLGGGGGYTTSVIEGIEYAYANGADVVSMSFRTYTDTQIMHDTFIAAYDNGNGLLPVGGAGNENSSELTYPACWPEVVEVGGTCSYYKSAGTRRDVQRIQPNEYGWGSNWGVNLEVMGPGYLYIATHVANDTAYYDGGSKGTFGGTSCATPCAAGCFGLLKSAFPSMNASELRQRMNETCDDLYTPGHDVQSGWGRLNIWRAIYGSDPNEDMYDVNGHIPLPLDNTWLYDSMFDITTSADYDFEDIFAIQADEDGVLRIEMDIITTGEDFDMALYLSSDLSGVPVAISEGPNGETNPLEKIALAVSEGVNYYLRVYSPDEYNCSNFRVKSWIEPHVWWIEHESLAPVFVINGSDSLQLLELEVHTNLLVTLDNVKAYITGDIPLGLVNHLWLYKDENQSGGWEQYEDTIVGSAVPPEIGVNQVIFDNLVAACTAENPLRYFIIADVGPNNLGYNIEVGIGLRSYKDMEIWQDVPLVDNPFPIFSDRTIIGEDNDPPEWDTTIGIQSTESKYEAVTVYWNHATDALSEPAHYNVYWDDEFPPEISTGMMIENITTSGGGDYDHKGTVTGLINDQAYSFCVRAADTLDNEDENETWLEETPDAVADPENPEVIDSLDLDGDSWEVWVHDQIAYVANGDGGIAIVDCTTPSSLVHTDSYIVDGCYGIQYNEDQDYVYASCDNGLIIVDPHDPGGPSLVAEYTDPYGALDVYVDGNICYVGTWFGELFILDITDPESPEFKAEMNFGSDQYIYGIAARDGYAYVCTRSKGLKIVNAIDPANPSVAKTLTLKNNPYEITLFGDTAHVTNWSDHRYYVIDISDPPNSVKVGELNITGGYAAGVAVRDAQYSYIGRFPNAVWTLEWDDLGDIHRVGSVGTQGPDGLFFDGTFLYAAENADGLKIIL